MTIDQVIGRNASRVVTTSVARANHCDIVSLANHLPRIGSLAHDLDAD
jgi:hypothetical protein